MPQVGQPPGEAVRGAKPAQQASGSPGRGARARQPCRRPGTCPSLALPQAGPPRSPPSDPDPGEDVQGVLSLGRRRGRPQTLAELVFTISMGRFWPAHSRPAAGKPPLGPRAAGGGRRWVVALTVAEEAGQPPDEVGAEVAEGGLGEHHLPESVAQRRGARGPGACPLGPRLRPGPRTRLRPRVASPVQIGAGGRAARARRAAAKPGAGPGLGRRRHLRPGRSRSALRAGEAVVPAVPLRSTPPGFRLRPPPLRRRALPGPSRPGGGAGQDARPRGVRHGGGAGIRGGTAELSWGRG